MLLSSMCRRQTPLLSVTLSVPVVAGQGYMHAITLSSSFLNLCSRPHPPLPTNPHMHQPCKVIPITAVLWRTSLGLQHYSLLPSAFFLCRTPIVWLCCDIQSAQMQPGWSANNLTKGGPLVKMRHVSLRLWFCSTSPVETEDTSLFSLLHTYCFSILQSRWFFTGLIRSWIAYLCLVSSELSVLKLGSHKHVIRWKQGKNSLFFV